MRLLEYEAKLLLREAGVPTPDGYTVDAGANGFPASSQPFPLVVKSQVPVGGRGKLGGVVVVTDPSKFEDTILGIAHLDIKGYTPKSILIERALDIKREFYLSLVINRETATVDLIAHPDGGIEVESQAGFFKNQSLAIISTCLANRSLSYMASRINHSSSPNSSKNYIVALLTTTRCFSRLILSS